MPNFEINQYLASRLSDATLQAKLRDIDLAAKEKIVDLGAKNAAFEAQHAAEKAAYDNSWVGKIGLESGGFFANRVNDAASLVSGASRLAGQTLSLPVNTASFMETAGNTEQETQAYNRYVSGKPQTGDIAILETPKGADGSTALSNFQNADKLRGAARDVNNTFDLNKIVDPVNRNKLSQDLGNGFDAPWAKLKEGAEQVSRGNLSGTGDVAKGIAGLLSTAGSAILSNPSAVREYVLENAPQLLVGAAGKAGQVGMAASNIGYAVDTYQQGIENYAKANNGQLPPEEQRQRMAFQAATLALAEEGSDLIGLGLAKVGGKASRNGFKNILKAAAGGFASEAPTEGYQTYMEGEITGKPASAKDVFTGAVIGGASGAGLTGGLRALAESTGTTPEKIEERTKEAQLKEVTLKAIQSGDVSAFLDEKLPTYAPEQAVIALSANNALPGATAESKQANLEKAGEIITGLKTTRDDTQRAYDISSPEAIADFKTRLVEATAAGETEKAAFLQSMIDEGEKDPKAADRLKAKLTGIDEQIKAAEAARVNMHQESQDKDVDVAKEIESLKSADPVVAQASAEKIINLSMALPDKLTDVQATALADDQTINLSQNQRTYLREFSAARQAENALKSLGKVSEDVLYGDGSKNLGIADYRSSVAVALSSGDQRSADESLSKLDSFIKDHTNKARVLAQAWNAFQKNPKQELQVVSDGKRGWSFEPKTMSNAEREANGAVFVYGATKDLVAAIPAEAEALTKAAKELRAAYAMKFSTTPATEVSNEQNVPEASSGIESATQQSQTQATQESGTVDQSTGTAEGTTGAVEAPAASVSTGTLGERVKAVLAKATRETKWGAVDDPIAQDLLKSKSLDSVSKVVEDLGITAVSGVLGAGAGSIVLDTDKGALRLGAGKLGDSIKSSNVIQPIASGEVGGLRYELMPKADTANITEEDVKAMSETLAKEGLEFSDPGTDNLGRVDGKLVVIDSGAVQKAPASSVKTKEAKTDQGQQQSTEGSTAPKSVQPTTQKVEPKPAKAEKVKASPEDYAQAVRIVESQKTEEPLDVPEGMESLVRAVQNNEEVDVQEDAPEQGLSALQEKTLEGASHREKKAGDFFKQTPSKDTDASKRPLVMVKDFLTQVLNKAVYATDFLKNGDATSPEQRRAFKTFVHVAQLWFKPITEDLVASHNELFNYEDPIRYFITQTNQDGKTTADVEENIKTAIVAGVFGYINDQSGTPLYNDEKAINALLGREKSTPVHDFVRKELARTGPHRFLVVQNVGKKITDALGLREASKDVPVDMLAKLQVSLGNHAIRLMEEKGLFTRQEKTQAEWKAIESAGQEEDEGDGFAVTEDNEGATKIRIGDKNFVFLQLQNNGRELTGDVRKIADSMKGSSNIIDNLFGMESAVRTPSTEPIKKVQETSKTGMGVPSFLQKLFKKKQTEDGWVVNERQMKVLSFFDRDEVSELYGAKEEAFVHKRNLSSWEAKKAGLHREYNQFMDWFGEAIATAAEPYKVLSYMAPDMWNMQRQGLKNSVANPQSSKVVRQLMSLQAWNTEVKLNDPAMLNSFMLRVAEGMGRKTERFFSQPSLDWIQSKMADPVMSAGVEAAQVMLFGKEAPTDEQKQAFTAAVKAGGEKLHSMSALMAWAQYKEALKSGPEASFETNLMGEVDGVSNGSILNHVLYGAAAGAKALNELLQRGGIYTASAVAQKYNEYYSQGGRDIYQHNASLVDAALTAKGEGNVSFKTALTAIWATSKVPVDDKGEVTAGGRDMLKTALNPLNYGSGFKSIKKNMSAKYVDGIYAQLEKFAEESSKPDNKQRVQLELNSFIQNLNTLLGDQKVHEGRPIEFYMNLELTKSQTRTLENTYSDIVADTAEEVVKETFKDLLAGTKAVTTATNTAFAVYNAVYTAERAAFIKELGIKEVNRGNKDRPNIGPEHDLTAAQEEELKIRLAPLVPIMHTAMSAQEGNIYNGLMMAKKKRKTDYGATYEVSSNFPKKSTVDGTKTMRGHGQSVSLADPSVMPISASTQAVDAAISAAAQTEQSVLNLHDANGDGVGTLHLTAQALNKATWDNLMAYSPLAAAHEALMRTVRGVVEMERAGTLSPEAKEAIRGALEALASKTFGKETAETIVANTAYNTFFMAANADSTKYQAMSQWTVVDQYAFDGGSYTVTDKNREDAAKKADEVPQAMKPANEKLLQDFTGLVSGNPIDVVYQAKTKNELTEDELATLKVETPDAITEFFKANPTASVTDVIGLLAPAGMLSDVNRKLLQLVSRVMDKSVKVRFLTPGEVRADNVLALPKTPSYGWYVSKGDKAEIYLMDKGLTAETILHELIHAAITQAIHNPSEAAKELVAELGDILTQAKDFVGKLTEDKQQQFAPALTSIDELVAWGMTNQAFQQEVLEKFTIETKTAGNSLVTAMQGFIAALVKLLRGKQDTVINSGLITLTNNVAGLFAEAGQQKQGDLIKTFKVAVAAVDLDDSWNSKTPEAKAKVAAAQAAYTRLFDATKSMLLAMSKYGSEFTEGLKERLDLIDEVVGDDEDIDLLVDLYNETKEFKDAFNEKQGSFNFSMASPIDTYSTLDIHRALDNGTLDPTFQDHLANLLSGIVESIHGPFGALMNEMKKSLATDPIAVWARAVNAGHAPFASAITASNFAGTGQEHFAMTQVEATVRAALDGTDSTHAVYKELAKLFGEAKSQLKPSDFANAGDYEFIFNMNTNNGERSDYLSRFAAIGLANKKVNDLLKFNTAAKTSRPNATLFDRLMNLYGMVMTFLSDRVTKVYSGQRGDSKLETLVTQLVEMEARKREVLQARQNGQRTLVERFEKSTQGVADTVRTTATAALGSQFVRNNSSNVVRGVGAVARSMTAGNSDKFMDAIRKTRDKVIADQDGVMMGIFTAVKGPLQQFEALLRETKKREKDREGHISRYAEQAMYAWGNVKFTKEQKASVTAVLMRTGLHNLLGPFALNEIEQLISKPAELNKAIADYESKLTGRLKDHYIHQANGLGYYKATGINAIDVLMKNATLISGMRGTKYQNQTTEAQAKVMEPIIAGLATLYALKYTDAVQLHSVSQLMRDQNQRTDGNGAEFMLKAHKDLEKESLDRIFDGNPLLMEHGYTPDIVNPYTDIKVVDQQEGESLVRQGYSKVVGLAQDSSNVRGTSKAIYVLRDGGLMPWLSGIFSLTSRQAKGTSLHNGYRNINTAVGLENEILHMEVTDEKLDRLDKLKNPRQDLSMVKGTNMAPVYNDAGGISNWAYLMQHSTKDNLLERDNNFDTVLGVLAGSIYDKETSKTNNEKALRAMEEQYEADKQSGNLASYISVGPKSASREMRELWRLLPQETKDASKHIFGTEGIKVRKDSVDLFFGYRKLSASDFLRKDRAALDGISKIARNVFHLYATTRGMNLGEADDFAKRMGTYIRRGERGWQEVVKEVKDIVVIKNIITLLSNIYGNDSMLFLKGVENRWQLQHTAIQGALDYQRDSTELENLENNIRMGYIKGDLRTMEARIVKLKNDLDRNPVKPLIDAGLMPTIVEDVGNNDNVYSYKSMFARKAEGIVNKVPGPLKTLGKNVYLTHDTAAYKFLSKTTQLSDFTARYALYKHLTQRADNPLSHEQAASEASDTFINYDIPMNRKVQYLDDMGVIPFTKYFFRIQRVLMKTFKENPGRVLALLALAQAKDLGPIVLDSSWIHHLGNNPVRSGAFQIFGVMDELPALKVLK